MRLKYLFWILTLWGSPSLWAASSCLPRQSELQSCPLNSLHLDAVREFDRCQTDECRQNLKAGLSNSWIFNILGVKETSRLNNQQLRQIAEGFFEKYKTFMVNEFAQTLFDKYRADRRDDNLAATTLSRYHALQKIAQRTPSKAHQFETFKKENAATIYSMTLQFGTVVNGQKTFPPHGSRVQPFYWPDMRNGIDIANSTWEELNSKRSTDSGRQFNPVQSFLIQAERQFNSIKKHMVSTTDSPFNLREIKDIPHYLRNNYYNVIHLSGFSAQINGLPPQSSPLIGRQSSRPHANTGTSHGNRGRVLRALNLPLSLAVSTAALALANQSQCEASYKFSPVNYESYPHGPFAPETHCKMVPPTAGQPLHEKVKNGLINNPTALHHLNEDRSDNSMCAYLVAYYNANFCTPLSDTFEQALEPNRSSQ